MAVEKVQLEQAQLRDDFNQMQQKQQRARLTSPPPARDQQQPIASAVLLQRSISSGTTTGTLNRFPQVPPATVDPGSGSTTVFVPK
jgi:hypothetical protein